MNDTRFILENITTITPVMLLAVVIIFGMMFLKEWRDSRKRDFELRIREFEYRKEEKNKPADKIVVENNNISGGGENPDMGGYVTLKIDDDRKSIFHDLLKGFEEYAELKGYKASVSIDTSSPGVISFKITINEFGITSSRESIKQDLDEYIQNIQSGNPINDLPRVLNEVDHARLSMALKNRVSFLQQNYEVEKNIKEFYKNFISSLPSSSVNHLPPAIQFYNGNVDMDKRKYEASNSANISQGDNQSNQFNDNEISVGENHSERNELLSRIGILLSAMREHDGDEFNNAERHFENIKEEIEESKSPDKNIISKWLNKAKTILNTAQEGSDVLNKAKEVYESFGSSL